MNKTDEQNVVCTDKNQSAVKAFCELVKRYSYNGKEKGYCANTNFVFFVGAGFSKAWDTNFDDGRDLFGKFLDENRLFEESLKCYLRTMSWCKPEKLNKEEFNIEFADFKKIVFSLGMYEKYRELRPKYIDSNSLKMIREKLNALIAFKIWKHNPYSQESNSRNPIIFPSEKLTKEQIEIVDFFKTLRYQKNNDSQEQEGIRINHITTNYDFVIECICDIWAYEYDRASHLQYVYRGFTPSEHLGFSKEYVSEDIYATEPTVDITDLSDISKIKDQWVESLFKLNGGLELYCNSDGTYRIDHRKKGSKDLLKESPLLILPSYEQDYSHSYFKEILQKSKELLTIAKVLIIVGYSLPEEDILIRFLLKHFALDKTSFQDKSIFYINKEGSHNKLRKKLKSVFKESIDFERIYTFSGSFNEFVEQFNQLWRPNEKITRNLVKHPTCLHDFLRSRCKQRAFLRRMDKRR